jgi:hypothetical protein
MAGVEFTISRILAWAVRHRAETGRWPTRLSGRLLGEKCDLTWKAIDLALCLGFRGLPGGKSLGGLICDHSALLKAMAKDDAQATGRPGASDPGGRLESKRSLDIATILAWADSHHAATGRWPSSKSGPVAGEPDEKWDNIARALAAGFRGLPGGTTLRHLLAEHRGPGTANPVQELTLQQILDWADAYHQVTGNWPAPSSGPIAGTWRLSWSSIDRFLRDGERGLKGGTSLTHLLRERRGRPRPKKRLPLSIEQILAWADAHHAAYGNWPKVAARSIAGTPGETWKQVDAALRTGQRGLPGGSSLPRLLEEYRAVHRETLSVEMILAWCHEHHALTGRWPHASSGAIAGVPGETWSKIDSALRAGCRGLRAGSSLSRLLLSTVFPDGKRNWRPLTIEQILAWADAHYAATGRWPKTKSGVVRGAPAEKWQNLYLALRKGLRGLAPGISLAALLAGRQPPVVAHSEGGESAASR